MLCGGEEGVSPLWLTEGRGEAELGYTLSPEPHILHTAGLPMSPVSALSSGTDLSPRGRGDKPTLCSASNNQGPLLTTKATWTACQKASFLPGSVGSRGPALPLPTPECLELDGDRGWQRADPPAQGYQEVEFREGTYAVTFQGRAPP